MINVNIEESWKKILADVFSTQFFSRLTTFVRSEYSLSTVYPPAPQIFNAFNLCPFDNVRVVIIGQDPYHNPGQAHGLSFSVPDGTPLPPSLKNIFKEIEGDLGVKASNSGDLTRWALQGVLLLNAILTVRENKPGSHQKKGWEQFTDAVIEKISNSKKNVVFMLWGNYANEKGRRIDRNQHLVLYSAHPSPLSARRGFFGSRHFSQCNSYLESNGQTPINWK